MADIKQITLPNGSVYNIKDEVARNAISNLNSFNIAVVQSLPTQNIDSHTIYFLGNPPSVVGEAAVGSAYVTEENNIYEEWIYVNNRWEMVGTTEVNLDDYVPTSRKVNGKELSDDITIGAGDIDFDTQGGGTIPLDEAIHGLVNGLSSVAWSGSYNDLSDTPSIPIKTSDLTNDSNFQTSTQVSSAITSSLLNVPAPTSDGNAANKKYVDDAISQASPSLLYWANIAVSSDQKFNAAPEMASLKLNGNTNAAASSTIFVNFVFDSSTQTLNFVFN